MCAHRIRVAGVGNGGALDSSILHDASFASASGSLACAGPIRPGCFRGFVLCGRPSFDGDIGLDPVHGSRIDIDCIDADVEACAPAPCFSKMSFRAASQVPASTRGFFHIGPVGNRRNSYVLANRHTSVTRQLYDSTYAVLNERIHRSWRLAIIPAPIPSLPIAEGFFHLAMSEPATVDA